MKRNIRRATWTGAVAFFLFFPASALAVDEDLGERLIRSFFEASRKGDQAAVERTLAQGFQSVHTDGVRDRSGEIELIRDMKLGASVLTNFKTTRNGPALVVTFAVNTAGAVLGGKTVAEGSYGRMAIWLEADSGWKLIAYANLAPLKD